MQHQKHHRGVQLLAGGERHSGRAAVVDTDGEVRREAGALEVDRAGNRDLAALLEPKEAKKRAEALVKKLRWTKPWFVVSAIQAEGTKEVTFAVMDFLEAQRRAKK